MPTGTLIIRAAEQVGIEIPRFCDHPLLEPVGACRQCYVEIEGQRKLFTSCTTTVAPGMVVMTQNTSPQVEDAQVANLEFLLLNHPLDCPICDRGGECPLQDQALTFGPGESRYIEAKRTYPKPLRAVAARRPGPRAVRAVRPLHAVLRPDLRRPVHRAVRPRRRRAGRDRARRGLPIAVQREHRPDLPGRRAHGHAVPVRRAAVRPLVRSTPCAPIAARAATSASTSGAARSCGTSRATTSRSTTRGSATRAGTRSAFPMIPADHHAADARSRPGAGVVRRGPRPGSAGVVRRQARRVPDRRPADGRGLLRAVEARADGLRDERPRSSARRRRPGRRGDRRARVTREESVTYDDVERAKVDPGRRPRRRAGGADPAPAPAQGRPARRADLRAAPAADAAVRRGGAHPVPPGRGAGRSSCGDGPTSIEAFRAAGSRRRDPRRAAAGATARHRGMGLAELARSAGARFAYVTRRANDRGALGRACTRRSCPGPEVRVADERDRGRERSGARSSSATEGRNWWGILEACARPGHRRPVPGRRRSAPRRPRRRAGPRALQNVPSRGRAVASSSATLEPYADAFLPAAAFLEKDGHVTTGRGATSGSGRSAARPASRSPDWEIFAGLALAMGGDLGFETLDELQDEMGGLLAPREAASASRGDRRRPPGDPRGLAGPVHLPAARGRGPAARSAPTS